MDLTFPEALTVAVDLNLAIARIFKEMATHLDREDGTIPEWERQMTEWRKKGTEGPN